MEVQWKIGAGDIARLRQLINQQKENKLVRIRRRRNLAKSKSQVRRRRFWKLMVCMRLTTQQPSGPYSHVANFARKKPFPLSYDDRFGSKPESSFNYSGWPLSSSKRTSAADGQVDWTDFPRLGLAAICKKCS